ncbi:MAG: nitroreductase family protein [Parachlamydiales bacterium]|nr:nitroreductase family protein [Parachlamydiales bacterium]
METLQAIFTRRSIRKFNTKSISREQIKTLLQAAMSAPSARNQQPWQFIVIQKKELLKKIPALNPNAAMCKEAPLAILICGDLDKEISTGYWVQDCAAATQNLLLAAHALHLGAVWTGVYPREERIKGLQELLSIPQNAIPFSLVVIGHPEETKETISRYLEERIHFDTW